MNGPRTLTLSSDQLRLIAHWAREAATSLEQTKLLAREGSPQEESALADLRAIAQLQVVLRAS